MDTLLTLTSSLNTAMDYSCVIRLAEQLERSTELHGHTDRRGIGELKLNTVRHDDQSTEIPEKHQGDGHVCV